MEYTLAKWPYETSTFYILYHIRSRKRCNAICLLQLTEQWKLVFLEPDAETFELYTQNTGDVIIIKHLVSEAPLIKTENIIISSIEKFLVDMITDTNIYATQLGELDFIYQSAFDKFEVNQNKMKRYAHRRNRKKEVKERLNLTLANN